MPTILTVAIALGTALLAGCVSSGPEPKSANDNVITATATAKPKPSVTFIYSHAQDIAAVRALYSGALKLKELSANATPQNEWVAYQLRGDMQLIFFRDPNAPAASDAAFAWQPGDDGEGQPRTSFSLEIPYAEFQATIKRLQASGVVSKTPAPTWRQNSYWGFTLLDPAGNTVEVYSVPDSRPASTTWR